MDTSQTDLEAIRRILAELTTRVYRIERRLQMDPQAANPVAPQPAVAPSLSSSPVAPSPAVAAEKPGTPMAPLPPLPSLA